MFITSLYSLFLDKTPSSSSPRSVVAYTLHCRKEDFYLKHETGECPDYDILVTNPPYSEDHIEKILNFCVNAGKPYFLLLPNYVYTKV